MSNKRIGVIPESRGAFTCGVVLAVLINVRVVYHVIGRTTINRFSRIGTSFDANAEIQNLNCIRVVSSLHLVNGVSVGHFGPVQEGVFRSFRRIATAVRITVPSN